MLVFCIRCGRYAELKVCKLGLPCPGRPDSVAARRSLDRLKARPPKHPKSDFDLCVEEPWPAALVRGAG